MGVVPSTRNWESDPATDGQKGVLRKYKVISEPEIQNITKGEASILIDRLFKQKKVNSAERATEAQFNLIKRLVNRQGEDLDALWSPSMTKYEANVLIRTLKSRGETLDPQLEEGLYVLDGDIFKIKKSRYDNLYALKLTRLVEAEYVSNGIRSYNFVRSSVGLTRFTAAHKMTREQAQAFGLATNVCVRCGRQLDPNIKNEDGSERWIGPDCEAKMGW